MESESSVTLYFGDWCFIRVARFEAWRDHAATLEAEAGELLDAAAIAAISHARKLSSAFWPHWN